MTPDHIKEAIPQLIPRIKFENLFKAFLTEPGQMEDILITVPSNPSTSSAATSPIIPSINDTNVLSIIRTVEAETNTSNQVELSSAQVLESHYRNNCVNDRCSFILGYT